MRGSVADMLPSGWELSPTQSLAGADPDLMAQREKDFFVCVDGAVFSKDFATKAQAMKTVSLGQVGDRIAYKIIIQGVATVGHVHVPLLHVEFFCSRGQRLGAAVGGHLLEGLVGVLCSLCG